MKHENLISKAFNSIVILIILLILIAASVIVYRSFQKNVEADIFLYTRDLEDRVKRTAAAEYRRYFLLTDIGETFNFNDTEEDIRAAIELKAAIFSPEGGLPQLMASIGYYNKEESEEAFEYNLEFKSWQNVENIFSHKKSARDFDILYESSDEDFGEMYLIIDKNGAHGLFLKLDSTGFIETYIKENVEAIDSELVFKWSDSLRRFPDAPGISPGNIEPDGYNFKPIRILLGINNDDIPLNVEIPAFFNAKITEETDEIKHDRPPFVHTGIFVEIHDAEGSYFYKIEHKAAVNFVETLLIMIILGVLFFLLISQLHKTRQLRRKEREFVASVTHELRTPLTVIRSAADNLSTGIVPEEKLKIYAGLINDQSDRLAKMIEEILLYSKFEDKQKTHDLPEKIKPEQLITGLSSGLDSVADSEKIKLNWDVSGLPAVVKTYPEVISLVLNNLVTNALNHAYTGQNNASGAAEKQPEIRIRVRYLIPGKLLMEVEDDGRGIDARELKNIFEPFYRDNVSRSRQEKGSGLGLFIARQKAILSGGKLNVESPYRRIDGRKLSGCRFSLILPCVLPEENKND